MSQISTKKGSQVIKTESADLLVTAHTIAGFNQPSRRDFQSMKNHFDRENPLDPKETYIYHKEDLVTLKNEREEAWVEAMADKVLPRLPRSWLRVSHTTFHTQKTC